MVRDDDARIERRERWEARTSAPLMIGAAAFLVAYSELVLDPQIAPPWRALIVMLLAIVWIAFIIDIAVRLTLTPRGTRAKFVRANTADAASAIVPLVRPFQLLKYLPRIRWFRGSSGDSVRSRLVVAAVAYATLFVYVIALAVLAVERDAPGATIVTFGDAVWWACVTVATVGYGDHSPVTTLGRMLAVVLMAGGVAIIGAASATIISYLGERITHAHRIASDDAGQTPDTTAGAE